MTKRRIDLTDPDALRSEAQRLRGKASAWSDEAKRRLDAAPGGFVTGRSVAPGHKIARPTPPSRKASTSPSSV